MGRRPVSESAQEYARGIAGGLLFSLPLFYTMEVWWAGHTAGPLQLLLYVLMTFLLLLGYNRYAGMRPEATLVDVTVEAVEELGLGLLLSVGALWMLGRLTPDMMWHEAAGKVVMEGMIAAIGVSVGTAQLGESSQDEEAEEASRTPVPFEGQLAIAFCGAILFAANVAPTEEIVVIATEIASWQVLGLVVLSLVFGTVILFYSSFVGAAELTRAENAGDVAVGVVSMYAVALIASALMLWFFGRFDGLAAITGAGETVVLGVAATLGASAGRLLLQLQ